MNILIIISGSVSAFRSLDLIRLLVKMGHCVKTIAHTGGLQFVTKMSLEALSQNECITQDSFKMEHISLSRWADFILIYPASADLIAKMAHGFGGTIECDLILAKKPDSIIFFAPAMN